MLFAKTRNTNKGREDERFAKRKVEDEKCKITM